MAAASKLTRHEHAEEVHQLALSASTLTAQLEAHRLYAEIMGFISVRHSGPPAPKS